jgi:hypothetical protein
MCEPTTMGAVGLGLLGGMAVAKSMTPDMPQQSPTAPASPPKPSPQSAKQPQVPALRAANAMQTGVNAAPSSTFLTGPGGIDPKTLQLGRNTLLGQ